MINKSYTSYCILIFIFFFFKLQDTFAKKYEYSTITEFDTIEFYVSNDMQASKEYINRLLDADDLIERYKGQYCNALFYYKQDYTDTSKLILEKLLAEITQDTTNLKNDRYSKLLYKVVNKLFYNYIKLSHYEKGITLLDKTKRYLNPESLVFMYAVAKIELGYYKEAIDLIKSDIYKGYIFHRIQVAKSKKDYAVALAHRYNNLGNAYEYYFKETKNDHHLDSALCYYYKAREIILYDDKKPDATNISMINRVSNIYILRKQYEQALKILQNRTLPPIINKQVPFDKSVDIRLSECFFYLKKYDSCIYYTLKFMEEMDSSNMSVENNIFNNYMLSESYNHINNTEKAYFYAQKCIYLTEQLENNKKNAVKLLHNIDIKEIIQQNNKIIDQKSNEKNKYIIIAILLIIALISFIVFLIYRNKRRKQIYLNIINELHQNNVTKLSDEPVIYEIVESEESQTEADIIDTIPDEKEELIHLKKLDEAEISKIELGLTKLINSKAFLKDNFKLVFIAKKLNTNTVYLSAYFNQVKKQSFSDYMQSLRINYTLDELKNNEQFRKYTLQAIAEEVGYKNATTFVRVFKKTTGISPTYYIESLNRDDKLNS